MLNILRPLASSIDPVVLALRPDQARPWRSRSVSPPPLPLRLPLRSSVSARGSPVHANKHEMLFKMKIHTSQCYTRSPAGAQLWCPKGKPRRTIYHVLFILPSSTPRWPWHYFHNCFTNGAQTLTRKHLFCFDKPFPPLCKFIWFFFYFCDFWHFRNDEGCCFLLDC